jgi:TrmH family RNA methyltransferase
MDTRPTLLGNVDVILHRPQSSENIGAVARAMKNFGLRRLVLVAPRRYEAGRAETLAVHAEDVLHEATVVATLEEAIAPYSVVIPTTERAVEGRPAPLGPRACARRLLAGAAISRVALLFGAEATGVSNSLLARFVDYSSIPSDPGRRSLNLAQAALLYLWELYQESELAPALERPDPPGRGDEPAPLALANLLRERAQKLFVANGFLNPQQPDKAMDELLRLLQRAGPTRRELELLLAALAQVERTSTVGGGKR